ncbi:hypothetical protein L0657_08405 [Dyadobacter sp. CY345]|uniref:hypothetical protein n=1 Tax=Dyadobacter sp. CY345 TaxID=2909335 RepID=UPI001F2B6FC1|nr:hypothetical protein [Dyadobacter sp. CY345]MCF2443973.1 hypothetical protein [Dyadobacter sp. CY345]
MAKKKSWLDKLNDKKDPKIKRTEYDFADIPAGSNMFIATPQLIDQYIREIGFGKRIEIKNLRKDLALEHNADYTCPVTTGLFLRIVAEANYEKLQQGKSLDEITPFWRAIEPNSALAKKLTFGQHFLIQQINSESESIEPLAPAGV